MDPKKLDRLQIKNKKQKINVERTALKQLARGWLRQ